jgi:hypothetical protein
MTKAAKSTKSVKMIQVSGVVYERLMIYKAVLMRKTKKEVTFNQVIEEEFNKTNHLTQLIHRLVYEFPETREKVEEAAKLVNAQEHLKAIIETAEEREA